MGIYPFFQLEYPGGRGAPSGAGGPPTGGMQAAHWQRPGHSDAAQRLDDIQTVTSPFKFKLLGPSGVQ